MIAVTLAFFSVVSDLIRYATEEEEEECKNSYEWSDEDTWSHTSPLEQRGLWDITFDDVERMAWMTDSEFRTDLKLDGIITHAKCVIQVF